MRKQSDKLKVVGLPNDWLEVFKTVDDMEDKKAEELFYITGGYRHGQSTGPCDV